MDAAAPEPPHDAEPTASLLIPSAHAPLLEGPHGGSITDLAVTADGTAAVTSDDLGGHRLWPALDGSLEPRVIELPSPSQLALARDPKGFLIALIDEAGGLVLQLVDRDGAMLQRATLPLEPTYKGVAMTSRGPLAWRSDQRIVQPTSAGTITRSLATEQGHRILQIAVPATPSADRAIVVIEGSTDTTTWRRARWLAIGDELAWGPWIAAGDAVEPSLAVSPDLERLAYLIGTQPTKLIVRDTATGAVLIEDNAFNATALELPDRDHAVYAAGNGQIIWLDLATTPRRPRSLGINQVSAPGVLASGGGKSFSPNGSELAISDATKAAFLGYALQATQLATAAGAGQLAIAWGDRAAVLDDKLHARPLTLFPANYNLSTLRWLAGDDWLVQAVKVDTATTILAVVNAATQTRTEVRTNQPAGQLGYEPSTRLVGVSYGVQPEVYRHASGRLDSVAPYPKPPPYDRVLLVPVSPALAGGTQLVVAQTKDSSTIRWVADPRALDKGPAITIDGAVVTVDAAGKVYAWSKDAKGTLELAILRDGKRLGALAVDKGTRGVWPDAKGERVMTIHAAGLTMYDAAGATAWTRPISGVTHVVWLDDGAIAVVTALGIMRLDAATGAERALRCGWSFELAPAPHPGRPRVEPLCTRR